MAEGVGNWKAKEFEAMELFSPGAPIDEDALFAGRAQQIGKMIDAVLQRGQHAIVYGERGVGKTSLARTFKYKLLGPTRHLAVIIVNCDPSDTFTSIWRKVFRDLASSEGNNLANDYPGEISPDDVRRELSGFDLTVTPIVILDEFDQLRDPTAKTLIANTIKALSDFSIPATVILVGVANSVAELVNEHLSLSRAIVQVPMQRMSAAELEEIVESRLNKLGMKISRSALAQIIALSRGLPHYTHLLGQFSARQALATEHLTIEESHVDAAERDCLERANQTIRQHYHSATHSPRGGNIYKEVILACALAEPDEFGYFPPKAVTIPLSAIMKKPYTVAMFGVHLKRLCDDDRGSILEFTGSSRRFRYRFREPLMQPYVVLRGLAENLIEKTVLKQLMPNYLQPRLSSVF